MRSGEYLGQHPWMQAIVAGAHGGLILTGNREAHHYVTTGFNPLPYLGRRNLPMSILTLNLLSYLAGLGAQSEGFRTGQPWIVPSGITQVVLPSGRHVRVQAGQLFDGATEQGVYQLVGSSGTTLRAVNLGDFTASDIENAAPLRLEAPTSKANSTGPSIMTNLTSYVLAIIIALILLEALLVYRVRRPAFEA